MLKCAKVVPRTAQFEHRRISRFRKLDVCGPPFFKSMVLYTYDLADLPIDIYITKAYYNPGLVVPFPEGA